MSRISAPRPLVSVLSPVAAPRGRRFGKMLVITSLAATALVVQSVGISPASSAHASTDAPSSSAPAVAPELAAAVRAGTVETDIRAGRITVDQLVDAAQANLQASASSSATDRATERQRLTREITQEVAEARLGRPGQETPTVEVTADAAGHLVTHSSDGAAAKSDPVATTDSWHSFWRHVTDPSFKIHLSSIAVKIILSTSSALLTGVLCALIPAMACAVAGAIIAGLTTGANLISRCANIGMYIVYPGVSSRSYCG